MGESIRTICLVIITAILTLLLTVPLPVVSTENHERFDNVGAKYSPDLNMVEYGDNYFISVDSKTGVEYIICSYGISPRYNSDGSLYLYESN